jgi:hypothetical protein
MPTATDAALAAATCRWAAAFPLVLMCSLRDDPTLQEVLQVKPVLLCAASKKHLRFGNAVMIGSSCTLRSACRAWQHHSQKMRGSVPHCAGLLQLAMAQLQTRPGNWQFYCLHRCSHVCA